MSYTVERISPPLFNHTTPRHLAPVVKAASTSSDALLQASRRLDWRFLLPDPTLGRVAYIGRAEGSLLPALELFANTVQVFPPATAAAPRPEAAGGYDVVVATEPYTRVLDQAVALLRPGGHLYLEVRSPWLSLKPALQLAADRQWGRPGLGRPQDYSRAIQQLGLRTVESFWFWPDFETCTKIIPLQSQSGLLFALAASQATGGVVERWQTQGRRWLVRMLYDRGLLGFIIPSFGIVAW